MILLGPRWTLRIVGTCGVLQETNCWQNLLIKNNLGTSDAQCSRLGHWDDNEKTLFQVIRADTLFASELVVAYFFSFFLFSFSSSVEARKETFRRWKICCRWSRWFWWIAQWKSFLLPFSLAMLKEQRKFTDEPSSGSWKLRRTFGSCHPATRPFTETSRDKLI